MTTFGLLGFGRIGQRIARLLRDDPSAPKLVGTMTRDGAAARAVLCDALVCSGLDDLIARRPDAVVECASAATFASSAEPLLAAGIDVIPLSLTAFGDEATEARVTTAARRGPGRLEIPAGAMGSLDLIAAARESDLRRVIFRAAKPAAAWKLTRARDLADLDSLHERTVFLRASVRDVARRFPNLNTSVGVALAGLGLDRTEAELIVDNKIGQATFEVEIDAAPGPATIVVRGRNAPFDADPIDYTTFSVLRLLRRRVARIAI